MASRTILHPHWTESIFSSIHEIQVGYHYGKGLGANLSRVPSMTRNFNKTLYFSLTNHSALFEKPCVLLVGFASYLNVLPYISPILESISMLFSRTVILTLIGVVASRVSKKLIKFETCFGTAGDRWWWRRFLNLVQRDEFNRSLPYKQLLTPKGWYAIIQINHMLLMIWFGLFV